MKNKTKNTLRIVSFSLVLLLVFMKMGMIPFVDIYEKFWVLLIAYTLLLVTIRK